ncbi:MAG: phosphoribosylaminoimidazolesuccinocarboxamide synthase [Alphaproteobacteria bacterium]
MTNSSKRKKLYEGTQKILFEGADPSTLVLHFKDDAIANQRQKKGIITGKGVINNRISEFLMVKLGGIGIPTHFIKSLNMREQLVRKVDVIPIKVIVRNISAGKMTKRLSLEEGMVLPRAIIEFYLKSEQLSDPLVNDDHITSFGWANQFELEDIKAFTLRINDFLLGLFLGIGVRLIDFKLEFGRTVTNEIEHLILVDEISPDCCRLWDINTNEKLDKDRFRNDMGGVEAAYLKIAKKLGLLITDEDLQEEDL